MRPVTFDNYVGQDAIKRSVQVAIHAALERKGCVGHMLFTGPPGLGKTTLAGIVKKEMNARMLSSIGPNLREPSAVVSTITQLRENDIWFIDEIHGMSPGTAELLYPLMEDYRASVKVGTGQFMRDVELEVKPFTLIGATTRPAKLPPPLRDRFQYVYRFEEYSIPQIIQIQHNLCTAYGMEVGPTAALEMAKRCRGNPRIATNHVKMVRDYTNGFVDEDVVHKVMEIAEIDGLGLGRLDRTILMTIARRGPIGIQALASAINEDQRTVLEMYEPYLVRIDFVRRTTKGRMITKEGLNWLTGKN